MTSDKKYRFGVPFKVLTKQVGLYMYPVLTPTYYCEDSRKVHSAPTLSSECYQSLPTDLPTVISDPRSTTGCTVTPVEFTTNSVLKCASQSTPLWLEGRKRDHCICSYVLQGNYFKYQPWRECVNIMLIGLTEGIQI